jgi:enoyl-CoA hydratase/carnithine racemase
MLKILNDGRVRTLQLDRPDKLNALNNDLCDALIQALSASAMDDDIDVVVLCGSEKAFSAGADLPEALSAKRLDHTAAAYRLFHTILEFEKPIIAAVAGPAIGAGTTILLLCDIVYASETAQFSMPFSGLGLSPEAGASVTLPDLVGRHRAAELLMFSEAISAQEGLLFGLVNRVVPEGQVITFAQDRAEQLCAKSQSSVKAVKSLMRMVDKNLLRQQINSEWKVFIDLFNGEDAKEAFTAFVEKRRPNFEKLREA